MTAGSHNLIDAAGVNVCGLIDGVNGNIVGANPKLLPLVAYSNGSPSYFELDAGSPAIDAGDNSICAAQPVDNTSQNGLTRPQGERCDMGSYAAPPLVVFPGSISTTDKARRRQYRPMLSQMAV